MKLVIVVALASILPSCCSAASACVATPVLGSLITSAGDGGPATKAQLAEPVGLAYDSAGNLYVADSGNHKIRKIDTSGIISTFAGTGLRGSSGDGGQAAAASLDRPLSLAVDGKGNIYVGDAGSFKIRRIAPNGIISTFAGTGRPGYSGDGAAATSALLDFPDLLTVDASGNVFFADQASMVVRKIGIDGVINTVAGYLYGKEAPGKTPATNFDLIVGGLAVAPSGDLLISDVYFFTGLLSIDRTGNARMLTAPDGNAPVEGAAASASGMNATGIAVLADGSII